jgi:hypothetical protein
MITWRKWGGGDAGQPGEARQAGMRAGANRIVPIEIQPTPQCARFPLARRIIGDLRMARTIRSRKSASRELSPRASTCYSTPRMLLEISERLDQAFRIDQSQRLPGFLRLFSCIPRANWICAPLGFRLVSLISVHALPPQREIATTASKSRGCALDWMDVAQRRNPKGV